MLLGDAWKQLRNMMWECSVADSNLLCAVITVMYAHVQRDTTLSATDVYIDLCTVLITSLNFFFLCCIYLEPCTCVFSEFLITDIPISYNPFKSYTSYNYCSKRLNQGRGQ